LAVRHEELVEKIKKQVALEERAHRVVEKLTEITPSEEYLKAAVSKRQSTLSKLKTTD